MVDEIKIICPYKENGCGGNENCVGCRENPNKQEMDYGQFREFVSYWNCDSCKHCHPKADMKGIESPCKRLDHKKYCFAKAVFYSYDCGQRNGFVCSDFEPRDERLWMARHWQPSFIEGRRKELSDSAVVSLCINQNWEVRYQVNAKAFFDNDFLDSEGNLKWIRKGYYRRNRKSPIGYEYVWEYPDGTTTVGANSQRKEEKAVTFIS